MLRKPEGIWNNQRVYGTNGLSRFLHKPICVRDVFSITWMILIMIKILMIDLGCQCHGCPKMMEYNSHDASWSFSLMKDCEILWYLLSIWCIPDILYFCKTHPCHGRVDHTLPRLVFVSWCHQWHAAWYGGHRFQAPGRIDDAFMLILDGFCFQSSPNIQDHPKIVPYVCRPKNRDRPCCQQKKNVCWQPMASLQRAATSWAASMAA